MSTKSDQLEWRRSKVVELRARGMTHGEIADKLQVSRTSITSDIQYLRSQAKEAIREYVTEHLPAQYQVCLVALDTIIKRAFDIIETSADNREQFRSQHQHFPEIGKINYIQKPIGNQELIRIVNMITANSITID